MRSAKEGRWFKGCEAGGLLNFIAGAFANSAREHWNHDQLLTSTVHQAWLLSGKNEANFFEMVEQLAEISAINRGLTLPTDEAAGRRMGEYIKRASRLDTDQLLYAVVDRAVLVAAHARARPASSTTARN